MAMKQFQKAEEDYLQATQLENASFLSYVGLADCLRAEGMIARASPLYERALTMCRSSQ